MIENIKKYRQENLCEVEENTLLMVIREIFKLIPKVQELYPNLIGFRCGMGVWSFDGKTEAVDTEDNELCEFDLQDYINDYNNNFKNVDWGLDIKLNESCLKLYEMIGYLVDSCDLNCSTWIDGIQNDKVIFYRQQKWKSPFSTGTIESLKTSSLYKKMVEQKINNEVLICD